MIAGNTNKADKIKILLNPITTYSVPASTLIVMTPVFAIEQIISCSAAPIFGLIISMIIAQFAATIAAQKKLMITSQNNIRYIFVLMI